MAPPSADRPPIKPESKDRRDAICRAKRAHKTGKGKGKYRGGPNQAPVPQNELAWFKTFAHWGTATSGGLRCGYYNSSVGCLNASCGFVNACLV